MKSSQTNVLDKENVMRDDSLKQIFKNEKVLLSSKVFKFNIHNKQQERVLVITNYAIYNILPSSVVNSLMSILSSGARIKRKIALDKVHAVTISRFGFEFVIHVINEYDYRYSSIDFRDQILSTLCEAFTQHNKTKKMPCYFKDDMILIHFVTSKKDVTRKINKMPKDHPELMDIDSLKSEEGQKVKAEIIYNKSPTKIGMSIDDFQVVKVLGRGAYGKVMLCEHKKTHQVYAIKSLNKETLIQKDQIEHTRTEREILTRVNHPFIIQLSCAFQSEQKLFFVMPFIRGGELFYHLGKYKRFTEDWCKFYAGCLVLAIEYIHELGYTYRDLKPENILVNDDGYLILTDFGLAKKIKQGEYAHSFVGTADYLAPETILNDDANAVDHKGHNYLVDWWSLGIIIYEMVVGIPPFYHENQKKVFENIMNKEVRFPTSMKISDEMKDLICQLLIKNPEKRLGAKKGSVEIKNHQWFKNMDFTMLLEKKLKAPMIPQIQDRYDVGNFDKEFTSENPYFSVINQNEELVRQFDQEFQGMTYHQQQLQ